MYLNISFLYVARIIVSAVVLRNRYKTVSTNKKIEKNRAEIYSVLFKRSFIT